MSAQFTKSRSDAIRAALIERVRRDLHAAGAVNPGDGVPRAPRAAPTPHRLGSILAGAIALVLIAGVSIAAVTLAVNAPAPVATTPVVESTAPFRGVGSVIERDGRVTLCLEGQEQSLPPSCMGAVTLLEGWLWDGIPHSEAAGVRFTESPVTVRGTLSLGERASDPPTLTLTEPAVAGAPVPGEPEMSTWPPSGLSESELQAIARRDLLELIGPGTARVDDGVVVATVAFDDGSLQGAVDDEFGPGIVYVTSLLRTEVVVMRAGGSIALIEPWPFHGGPEPAWRGQLTRDEEGCFGAGDAPVVFPYGSTLLPDGSGVDVPGHGRVLIGDAFEVGGWRGELSRSGACQADSYWFWQ